MTNACVIHFETPVLSLGHYPISVRPYHMHKSLDPEYKLGFIKEKNLKSNRKHNSCFPESPTETYLRLCQRSIMELFDK